MLNGAKLFKKEILRHGIFICSIVFVIIGIFRNEVSVVWQKAINICLECIGIG